MKDYAKINTSEPMNKYEMFIHGVAFVTSFIGLIVWILL